MPPPRGRPRSLEDYLSADASLARLSAHARRLLRFQRIFESATPLARQSRVANLRLGKIIIHAANGAVATKLRQLEPRLVAVFRNEGAEITGIDIRLQPGAESRSPARIRTAETIGPKQKQALTSLADGLPEDSRLRDALRRLVGRAK
ncbi:MAG: DUF721 domain-containing protein [Rhodocyclales bacterium]|nr:DUF721 domain-containing protein [Rhodocyclales bacterium]